MPAKKEYNHFKVPLNGRLITSEDPVNIGTNYQTLKNMRYTDTTIKAIKGMTKLNPTALPTYYRTRSMFHFLKAQPVESHLLAQSYSDNYVASAIQMNELEVPLSTDFLSGTQWIDATGAARGYFSDAPQGQVVYTNGKESVIWGGYEAQIASFIHYDAEDVTISKDYTDQLRSKDTDADGVATLDLVSAGNYLDSSTVLLIHGSTNFDDSSPTTPHTPASHGGAVIDTADYPFGGGSMSFDGSGDYVDVPDNADFNFSATNWTIDFWMKIGTKPAGGSKYALYYHDIDANNYILIDIDSSMDIGLTIVDTSSPIVSVRTSHGATQYVWQHIAVQQSATVYSIFINGVLKASVTDASVSEVYDRSVYIGRTQAGGSQLNGKLAEYRISSVARYTGNFTPPSAPYLSGSTTTTSFYIGATRPLEAFKLYIGTPNAVAGITTVYYWDGENWTSVTNLINGTTVSVKPLAQDGFISFDDTDGLAKQKQINGVFLTYYKVEVTPSVSATTTLTYATVRPSWQKLKDVWDGEDRPIVTFILNKDLKWEDYSTNVLENSYNSADAGTYAVLNAGSAFDATDYIYAGFVERQTALTVNILENNGNTTAATGMAVEYWSGSAWVAVNGLEDGTSFDNVSFARSGIITWDAPNKELEFKYVLNTKVNKGRRKQQLKKSLQKQTPPLYYYRLSFTKTLSATKIYYVAGVPAPDPPVGYSYSFMADNRQWLLDETDENRNKATVCSVHAPDVWNGEDTSSFFFGSEEPLTCGAGLFVKGSDTYQTLKVIFKANETWIVTGFDNETWKQSPDAISSSIGCVAPGTLRVVNWRNGQVLIFQGSQGVYMFDGASIVCISDEISDLFEDGIIDKDEIKNGYAFVDELLQEYHWLIDDREFVYDLKRSKPGELDRWFEAERGPEAALLILKAGCSATDANGNHHTYGSIDTGYVEHLEDGITFDSGSITAQFHTGDLSLSDDVFMQPRIRRVKMIGKAKTTTANLIAVAWHADTNTLDPPALIMAPTGITGNRVFLEIPTPDVFLPATLQSLKFDFTNDTEAIGFEPLLLSIAWVDGTSDL